MEKEHNNKTHSHLLGIVSQLSHHSFPNLHHIYNSQSILLHFFQKELVTTRYSSSKKSVTHLTGLKKEEPGWQVKLPRITQITHN